MPDPFFQPVSGTAWVGMSIAFEILCVLARGLETQKTAA